MGQTVKGDVSKPNRRVFSVPYEYRGKSLDPFQQEALIGLMQSMSTLVSVPDGHGKDPHCRLSCRKDPGKRKACDLHGPDQGLDRGKNTGSLQASLERTGWGSLQATSPCSQGLAWS